MEGNIFLAEKPPIQFEEYLQYNEGSRENQGEELPVVVYRLVEYSIKEELIQQFGKDIQVDIFRKAG